MAEMVKNVHVIKATNNLMPSHPGPPTANVRWLDSTRHVQEKKSGALMQSLLVIHLLAIQYLSWEATSDKNIESNNQRSNIVEKCTS